MSDPYDTVLTPADEKSYSGWAGQESKRQGRDVTRDTEDYDLRGLWKAAGGFGSNGHAPDTFKKPNHPTFSDQSQYHGTNGNEGGKWDQVDKQDRFTPGATNRKHYTAPQLQEYFDKREPGVKLNQAAPAATPATEYADEWNKP